MVEFWDEMAGRWVSMPPGYPPKPNEPPENEDQPPVGPQPVEDPYPEPVDMHTLDDRLVRADVGRHFAQIAAVSWGAMQNRDPGDEAWHDEDGVGISAFDEAMAQRKAPADLPPTNPNGDQALKGRAEGYNEGYRDGYLAGLRRASAAVQSSLAIAEKDWK